MNEAHASLYLRVFASDDGVKGDPLNCKWACAARRMYGGMALFFRTVAYIELEPGVLTRFAVPKEVRSQIEQFDKTGVMPSGTFEFHPTQGSQTLAAKHTRNLKHRLTPAQRKARAARHRPSSPLFMARGGFNFKREASKT